MLLYVLAALALALWFGGGVVAGFIAPQAAFGVLADRSQAGTIAGIVLSRYALLAVTCGAVYVLSWLGALTARVWPRRILILVGVAMTLVALSHWYITPQIAALRAAMPLGDVTGELQARFDSLHRLSVILFGVQWLLSGAALVMHLVKVSVRSTQH